MLDEIIAEDEYLYRGVVDACWDEKEGRPSSAAFKDSKGISVDRDGGRDKENCVKRLLSVKDFHAVCRLTAGDARSCDTFVKYLSVDGNEYHSEIHDSENQVEIKSKAKSRRLNNKAEVVFCKDDI